MKVLFVNHTAQVSGAERSLLALLELLGADTDVVLACPPGDLTERARAIGVETVTLRPTQLGFSASLRALGPAVAGTIRTGLEVRALARRQGADVVHAASTRAGLLTAWCMLSSRGRVVDVRDILPRGAKGASVRWLLRLSADAIVFNSRYTSERFGPTGPARAAVVYPVVDLDRLLDLPLPSGEQPPAAPVLGVIGQITPWKGQDDAIRILAAVREAVPGARLRIVGSVVFAGDTVGYDNERFGKGLPALAEELGVAGAVELTGETEDLRSALESIDVLLVPSWAEPFGRVVVEAMAAGVPVVATSAGGPGELIRDGLEGFLCKPRDPGAWARPVSRLLTDADLARRVAAAARERARSLAGDERTNATGLRRVYADLTGERRAAAPPIATPTR